ncbi:dystrotelin [Brachionichthys hirsutus]|uniref:dystrotelin n=1 Tax=Brachionichthys hirsutus TaxID=412623 RepID=UPI003605301D
MKLVILQKHCHMDIVSLPHIKAALQPMGRVQCQQEVVLNRQEVTQTLDRMFQHASQEVPLEGTAVEETCSLMFGLYDRAVVLKLPRALAALVGLAEDGCGSVSRSGLRCLLDDLSQIPSAVQEDVPFGAVEAAVSSCFKGVSTPKAGKQQVLSWLQSEPHLLLWLPTLYRLAVSQKVTHGVRCHTCKSFPITGLRYRCRKCVNVQVCQSCFLSDRETAKHKSRHPMMEFCTQPTWRESLSSLARNARHALLPRRYSQREADMRTAIMRAEQGALYLSRNLQRDKWLLEQQLQAWRLTVQSEQDVLGNRCSEMEVTMETLREESLNLQTMLTKAKTQPAGFSVFLWDTKMAQRNVALKIREPVRLKRLKNGIVGPVV